MEILWLFILWLHVIAAVVWIGGNLILAMVIVPYFKHKITACSADTTSDADW